MSTWSKSRGFTLIELLVVLVIVGVLSAVGVLMIGDRQAGAVRSVLDELEGTISASQRLSVATGRDVVLATQGNWTEGTPFLMAYGNAVTQAGAVVTNATILANGATAPEAFRLHPRSRDHMAAGIVAVGSDWWAKAATGQEDITTVAPFKETDGFTGLISNPAEDATNLANPDGGGVRVSGYNKRFTDSFYIAVVGLRSGVPVAGGPMGLVVVLQNGATVYKFYNPGLASGDGKWRKL